MADGSLPEVRIAVPLVEDFALLAQAMRPDEEQQYLALTGFPAYDAQQSARTMIATEGPKWCLIGRDNRPIAAGGFEPARPGVWTAWGVGSLAAWERYPRALTRITRKVMAHLFDTGQAQRIHLYALESRRQAHVWYERGMRMRREGTHPRWFANGETAVCYARTIDMHGESR